nr:hypothetical protein [uncultured Nitrososphaera sp.]
MPIVKRLSETQYTAAALADELVQFLDHYRDEASGGTRPYPEAIDTVFAKSAESGEKVHFSMSLQHMMVWDSIRHGEWLTRQAELLKQNRVLTQGEKEELPHPVELCAYLAENPEEFMENAVEAVKSIIRLRHPTTSMSLYSNIAVDLTGTDFAVSPLHKISADVVDELVVVEGKVVSYDLEKNRLVKAVYKCTNCNNEMGFTVPEDDHVGGVQKPIDSVGPLKCNVCGVHYPKRVNKSSRFERQQWLKIVGKARGRQRAPEMWIDARNHMAGQYVIGDNIRVTGISKLADEPTSGPVQAKKGIVTFDYIKAISIERVGDSRRDIVINEQMKKDYQKLARERESFELEQLEEGKSWMRNTLVDYLISLFSPSIYGHELVKLVLLLVAVSGNDIINSKRQWLNVYIVGDISEGKSDMFLDLLEVTDSLYQSAEGVTQIGLGAGMVMDKMLKRLVVGGGIGVNGHLKIKLLDEVNLMPDKSYFAPLRTMMEKGFFTLSKGGEEPLTLPTCGSWVAAANPTFGNVDKTKSIAEQTNVPPAVLSRFDLILVMVKDKDKTKLQLKMEKISAAYTGKGYSKPEADLDFLYTWLKIAQGIQIAGTPGAQNPEVKLIIDQYYQNLDTISGEGEILVTLRQYESLWRVTFAIAKLCHRNYVLPQDAILMTQIYDWILTAGGVDIKTGKRGSAHLFGYESKKGGGIMQIVLDLLRALYKINGNKPVSTDKIREEMFKRCEIGNPDTDEAMAKLNRAGKIVENQSDMWSPAP